MLVSGVNKGLSIDKDLHVTIPTPDIYGSDMSEWGVNDSDGGK